MSTPSHQYAFITLVTNPDYIPGVLGLIRSLKMTGTDAAILTMASSAMAGLDDIERAGSKIIEIEPLTLSDEFQARHNRQAQHARSPFTRGTKPVFHEALDNFCKLRLWQLEQYHRVVFIDADALVIRNIDKLFDYPEFSAAPNLYHELADMHRLNSGVFVAQPNKATFARMLATLDQPDAFWRRTDQTFLESFYPDWHGLPYTFNTLQYVYFNLPELWHWPSIRVLHYQYEKPWQKDHPKKAQLQPLIDLWCRVMDGHNMPETLPTLGSCASL